MKDGPHDVDLEDLRGGVCADEDDQAGKGEASEDEDEKAEGIVVQVRFKKFGNTGGSSEIRKKVRINPNEPISAFMEKFRAFAVREGLVVSTKESAKIVFQADGETLNSRPNCTANDLDIEEDDLVDVSVR